MSPREKHDTHQKALALILDTTIFGSFAEIRAGKEVAGWFLRLQSMLEVQRPTPNPQSLSTLQPVVKVCAASNGLRGVIQPFAAGDSEVGPRRLRTVAQTASGAAPPDVEALSTVCLRR